MLAKEAVRRQPSLASTRNQSNLLVRCLRSPPSCCSSDLLGALDELNHALASSAFIYFRAKSNRPEPITALLRAQNVAMVAKILISGYAFRVLSSDFRRRYSMLITKLAYSRS